MPDTLQALLRDAIAKALHKHWCGCDHEPSDLRHLDIVQDGDRAAAAAMPVMAEWLRGQAAVFTVVVNQELKDAYDEALADSLDPQEPQEGER